MTKDAEAELHGASRAETGMSGRPDAGGISRRAWLGGAAMVVGVGACLASTAASAKTAQADAKYQDSPKGQSKCGTCAQFQPPDACKLVDGKISENGWCQLYTPKAG